MSFGSATFSPDTVDVSAAFAGVDTVSLTTNAGSGHMPAITIGKTMRRTVSYACSKRHEAVMIRCGIRFLAIPRQISGNAL